MRKTDTAPRRGTKRTTLAWLAACTLWLAAPALPLPGHAADVAQEAAPAAPTNGAAMEEKWGVQVVATRLTADGYMIDFRYRVVGPAKAAFLSDRKIEPYLIDGASGARLVVPNTAKLGRLRQIPHARDGNRTYFMFFANPGRLVKPGAKVTLVIGDLREDLVVEG